MNKPPRILPLLGPGLVLYLVADIASLGGLPATHQGSLDLAGHVWLFTAVALAAVLSSLAPLFLRRHHGEPGNRRVGTLGVSTAVALLSLVRPEGTSLVVDVAGAIAFALVGALVLDLALDVPDAPRAVVRFPLLRALAGAFGVAAGTLGLLAVLPTFELFGNDVLVPSAFVRTPLFFALIASSTSLVLRLARSRAGRVPEALASSAWAALGLVPIAASAVGLVVLAWTDGDLSDPSLAALAAFDGLALAIGHARMLDPAERLGVGRTTRRVVAGTMTLVAVGAAIASVHEIVPRDPVNLAAWTCATLLVGAVLYRAFEHVAGVALSPFRGRLLREIEQAKIALGGVGSFGDLARAILPPMRRASGALDGEPFVYATMPAREAHIDAAGEPHSSDRAMPVAIADRLADRPGEVIVRADLESRVVRRPELRPLVEVLVGIDALCVVPLAHGGELEGALIVPRGKRRTPLSYEEVDALETLGAGIAAMLALISAGERAHERAMAAQRAGDRLEDRIEELGEELERARAAMRTLGAGRGALRMRGPAIAYGPAMRALERKLDALAPLDTPVLLLAEGGTAVDQIAQRVHDLSTRREGPVVIADCGATRAEQCMSALFGDDEQASPGWLRLAQGGSLLLVDLPALPLDVQKLLVEAIAERKARAAGSMSAYPIDVRVVATSRVDVGALVGAGTFDAELARWLAPGTARVPPLRERPEDISSLVLLAIDRACRVLGREVLGIDQLALDELRAHAFPWNLRELHAIVDRAVGAATAPKILASDLPPLVPPAPPNDEDALVGTFVDLERRILETALARGRGNKSAAARMLGLKRTTFLDKLRRHGLEEGPVKASEDAA